MDEAKKKKVFDQLKIELRSILLSAKHGVPESSILSDYQMLSCQYLPYRELGYGSVSAMLKDMPDVAQEIRLPTGDKVYKGVSDASTAHIQRLVGSQKSNQKKKSSMRGRGGRGRGSTKARGGRGSWGGSSRGSFLPRQPERGRGSFGQSGFKARGGSSFPTNKKATGFSGDDENKENFTSYRGRGGAQRGSDRGRGNASSRGGRGFSHGFSNNTNNNSVSSRVNSGAVRNDVRNYGDMGSPDRSNNSPSSFGQETSPLYNLKIGLSSNGERKIEAGSPLKSQDKASISRELDCVTPGGQIDLRVWLNKKTDSKKREMASADNRGTGSEAQGSKKADNMNQAMFKKNLPPRFLKKQKDPSVSDEMASFNRKANSHSESYPQDMPSAVDDGLKAECTISSDNWMPPENGAEYLATFYRYFRERGEKAPEILTDYAKYKKEKGFYGRVEYEGICYYPLEILRTETDARQNAARTFCMKRNIPLSSQSAERVAASNMADVGVLSPCPQPSWMATYTQQLRGTIDAGSSSATSSHVSQISPSQSAPTAKQSNTVSASYQDNVQSKVQSVTAELAKVMENVYMMLKTNGLFVRSLEDMYKKHYDEPLNTNILTILEEQTEYFKVEESIKGRPMVYPVKGAKFPVKSSKADDVSASDEMSATTPTSSSLEPSDTGDLQIELLEVGSELEVVTSYAYSASEIYFQLTESEDLIYEIDETLNENCQSPPPGDWRVPDVGNAVAACYEGGWYRAQIQHLTNSQAQVYFIDYGNHETVDLSDLRPLPQVDVILTTPPLAMRCALTSTQASHLQEGDVFAQLGELVGEDGKLKAVVLDNSDSACVVELFTLDGTKLLTSSTVTPQNANQAADISRLQPSIQKYAVSEPSTSSDSPDPGKLFLPDGGEFPVYICHIRTECTVLLRVVENQYSDALDILEQQIAEKFYEWPVPQEVKQRQVYATMILATADEAQDEGSRDQNKYHRVRILRKEKEGRYVCYLPDHGDEETLDRAQLREIDPALNRSLPYQAVMATLHGLDHIEESLRPIAMRILLKLINFGLPVYAVRKGYTESLEVDLVDTNEEHDVNINESVLKTLDEIREGLAQEKPLKELVRAACGSAGSGSGSQIGSSSNVTAEADNDDLQPGSEADEAQAKLKRIQNYVDNLPSHSPVETTPPKLYTWKVEDSGDNLRAIQSEVPKDVTSNGSPALPKYWPYPFLKSVSLYITSAESPSQFVAIPLEQQGALDKAESALDVHFSQSFNVAETLVEGGLYAVKYDGKYQRAVYLGPCGKSVKVFFPDHHSFDTVAPEQVLVLPEQFYSLPFLAYRMRLKDIKPPTNQDWPVDTCTWFKDKVINKAFYAYIFSQDDTNLSIKNTVGGNGSNSLPGALVVRLIDTSGDDDVILDELMQLEGLAVIDSDIPEVSAEA